MALSQLRLNLRDATGLVRGACALAILQIHPTSMCFLCLQYLESRSPGAAAERRIELRVPQVDGSATGSGAVRITGTQLAQPWSNLRSTASGDSLVVRKEGGDAL